mmetsp:Transcript_29289/g.63566  ORF Transcript_29289/g.63566 Transcript_29289/m.63566 type:complete len:175 (-) Transcript_29289:110-634(-)
MKTILLAVFAVGAAAFAPGNHGAALRRTALRMSDDSSKFEIVISMPPSNSDLQAQLAFPSVVDGPSELVEVRYKLPFGLDVAPQKGLAVCTKANGGGEQVGDILRYTSQWTMGLPRGDGLITTAASFSGGVAWQCSLFDVIKASSWEEVVGALTSNVESRTDEVLLIFERPLQT